MSLRDFCITLLAGGVVGAGGATIAHKAPAPQPAVEREAPRPRPARTAKRPRAAMAPAAAVIFDCPLPSADIGVLHGAVVSSHPASWSALPPGVGHVQDGGWFGPLPDQPPPTMAVPEAESWAMLVVGFGLIGLALRRGERAI